MGWTCSGCGSEFPWHEDKTIGVHQSSCLEYAKSVHNIPWDLRDFWKEFSEWSQVTFGSDKVRGPVGPLKHLYKEVKYELLPNDPNDPEFKDSHGDPYDLEEYADVVFLTFDSCRRAGYSYDALVSKIREKLAKNKSRKWPKPTKADQPVEHVRDEE